MTETETLDYYELLEISPQATQETIHRVYRYLAARYHPDSAGTGNLEKFAQLTFGRFQKGTVGIFDDRNGATRQATRGQRLARRFFG